jgi:hypothetical protein
MDLSAATDVFGWDNEIEVLNEKCIYDPRIKSFLWSCAVAEEEEQEERKEEEEERQQQFGGAGGVAVQPSGNS